MEYIMRAPSSMEFGCCAVNLEKTMYGQIDEKNMEGQPEPVCPVVS